MEIFRLYCKGGIENVEPMFNQSLVSIPTGSSGKLAEINTKNVMEKVCKM